MGTQMVADNTNISKNRIPMFQELANEVDVFKENACHLGNSENKRNLEKPLRGRQPLRGRYMKGLSYTLGCFSSTQTMFFFSRNNKPTAG